MSKSRVVRYPLLYGAVCGLVSPLAALYAAVVPPGVTLAPLQQLVINNGAEPQSLDPHKSYGIPEANVLRDLLEGLFSFDDTGQVVPAVAECWRHTADFKTWTFYLRPTARWSTGDPVTAEDFVFSWRRLAAPLTRSPSSSYLNDLQLLNSEAVIRGEKPLESLGVQALDSHTLQLTLSHSVPYLLDMLADISLYPVHRSTVERYGDGVDGNSWYSVGHFVGNGAYGLTAWVVNEKIVLTRSETYWDWARTVIDQVTYLTLADEATDIRRYHAGEIDITHFLLPTENYLALQQQLPGELRHFPSLTVRGYLFNTQRAPFRDVRVRQALSLALDREAIVNQFLVQGERAAYTLNSERVAGFKSIPPAWVGWSLKKRWAVAKQLLRAAGYSSQNPLRFRLLYNMSELHEQLALAVSDVWKRALGAEVTLEKQEWKVFLASCRAGEYQAARFGWSAPYNEPSALLRWLLSNSSRNDTFYHNHRYDHWLLRALQVPTVTERYHYYQKAEQLLAEEVPLLPLYHEANSRCRLVKPYVKGLSECDPMRRIYTKNLYLIQHPQAPSRYRQ